MTDLFINILNMSFVSSLVIIMALLLRFAFKPVSKWVTMILWTIVGVRLVCPIFIEFFTSLIPSAVVIGPEIMTQNSPQINTGIPSVNDIINPVIINKFSPSEFPSVNHIQILFNVLSVVWLVVFLLLVIYSVVMHFVMIFKLKNSNLVENNVYTSDKINQPCFTCFIKPKIYIPNNVSQNHIEYIISHEQKHIKRFDFVWKLLGLIILFINWLNPIVWIAYFCFCYDIELACDESCVKKYDYDQTFEYSHSLMIFGSDRKSFFMFPVSIIEICCKRRSKQILKNRKSNIYFLISSILICLVFAVCFLTNPVSKKLNKIDNLNIEISADDSSNVLIFDDGKYKSIGNDINEFLQLLNSVEISSRRASNSLKDDRDKTNTLVICEKNPDNDYSNPKGLFIHFNSDFTRVWINDNEKPTYSYEVIDPNVVKNIFNKIQIKKKLVFLSNIVVYTDYEDVCMTFNSINYYEGDDAIFDVTWHNNTTQPITVADDFSIEYKDGDKWISTGYNTVYFDLQGLDMLPYSSMNKTYTLSDLDLSKEGTYRVISPFYLKNDDQIHKTWIEFGIINPKTNY